MISHINEFPPESQRCIIQFPFCRKCLLHKSQEKEAHTYSTMLIQEFQSYEFFTANFNKK